MLSFFEKMSENGQLLRLGLIYRTGFSIIRLVSTLLPLIVQDKQVGDNVFCLCRVFGIQFLKIQLLGKPQRQVGTSRPTVPNPMRGVE